MDSNMQELPDVDDLQIVAEIAEAELAELRKIREAVDAQRDHRSHPLKSKGKSSLKKLRPQAKVSLTCTGDYVHVDISTVPQVGH